MTQLCCAMTIRFVVCVILVLVPTAWAQTRPPIAEQMAKTYGLDAFGHIEAIRYTFNLQVPGVDLSRSWVWQPQTDHVSYEGKDQDGTPVQVTYQRAQLSSQSDAVQHDIDPVFINDQFWLLFPLHVVWDGNATVTAEGRHTLPLGEGTAERVVVQYPSEGGGYAPGDTWELYVGADHRVEAFLYRGGGAGLQKRPRVLVATWAGYKQAGPLLISTEHQGTADGKPMRLFFSDVAVKLVGSDTWVHAH
jgi:hypothetical protein